MTFFLCAPLRRFGVPSASRSDSTNWICSKSHSKNSTPLRTNIELVYSDSRGLLRSLMYHCRKYFGKFVRKIMMFPKFLYYYSKLRLVIWKYLVSNISENKPFRGSFGTQIFIQKINPNARIPRIFMDSVDKSAFYICVFSRNKFIWLDAVYSIFGGTNKKGGKLYFLWQKNGTRVDFTRGWFLFCLQRFRTQSDPNFCYPRASLAEIDFEIQFLKIVFFSTRPNLAIWHPSCSK